MSAPIRSARLDDAAELAALCTELGYPSISTEIEGRLPRLLADAEHLLLVATDAGDRATGWLHAAVHAQLTSDAYVQVEGLVVASSRRGTGIGARLLAEAEAWAEHRGIRLVRVRSNVVRERAHRFYLRHGYTLAKTSHLFVKRWD